MGLLTVAKFEEEGLNVPTHILLESKTAPLCLSTRINSNDQHEPQAISKIHEKYEKKDLLLVWTSGWVLNMR